MKFHKYLNVDFIFADSADPDEIIDARFSGISSGSTLFQLYQCTHLWIVLYGFKVYLVMFS